MKKKTRKKGNYKKPEITKVRLDAEVLLATACKDATGPNFGSGSSRCHSIGSCVNNAQGS